ncbi:hypothetical protein [Candidatus Hodgkinia cicadicola]|uniref:hypothetical protein n=1 Tax=Candidatus Hodgkinia cicadicola TaxID=573658 RepID=UPI001788AA25
MASGKICCFDVGLRSDKGETCWSFVDKRTISLVSTDIVVSLWGGMDGVGGGD